MRLNNLIMFTEPVKGNAGNHTIVCLIAKLLHFSDSQQTHTSSLMKSKVPTLVFRLDYEKKELGVN